MKNTLFLITLVIIFSVTNNFLSAQSIHTVQTTSSNTFSPNNLTIQAGDTVKWINSSQGFHNVVADDGSFSSGSPSTDLWTFIKVFTQPGINPYYCAVHGGQGGQGMSGVITVENATDVKELSKIPGEFNLKQNYPNPFNPSTTIEFSLPQSNFTKLTIYNSAGQKITDLISRNLSKGVYSFNWNADGYASGIYFYRINSGNYSAVKKLILIK